MKILRNNSFLLQNEFQEDNILLFAREELKKYWTKIFGESSGENLFTIYFAKSVKYRFDGYSINIKNEDITISSSCSRGILYGVYELLKQIGCNFLFPSQQRQYIPELEQIELKDQLIEKNPCIEYRGLCLYNTTLKTLTETLNIIDYMAKNGYNFLLTSINRIDDSVDNNHAILWEEIKEYIYPELKKRGIFIDMSEHSTDYFFPREKWFSLHPEWFSLIDGKRVPLQICYSNPDAVTEYARSYREFVLKRKDFDMLGIWPLDGGGYCQCEKCSDPTTVFKANAKIANEIKSVRPDLIVEHLAYTPESFTRPKEDLPNNMSVLVCNVQNYIAHEWAEKAKNAGGAFYFDYHTADHYRFRANLWLNPLYCRETVNTIFSYGYRGIVSLYLPVTVWWQSSINYYYLSEAYYNPLFDLKEATYKLAGILFGKHHQNTMTDVLVKIFTGLQDRNLWSRLPHKPNHIHEHICNRNKETDMLHLQIFMTVSQDIQDQLNQIDLSCFSEFEKNNFMYLKAYLQLQEAYFKNIDQYDYDCDSPEKAEPYFSLLKKYENEFGPVFISENYARWRIVGRDNIFNPNNTDAYQPNE